MFFLILIALLHFFVGLMIGSSGIGGFIIPMVLHGLMGFSVETSFGISFISFTVAGALGTVLFLRHGNLDLPRAALLSVGSIPGSLAGVLLVKSVPESISALVFYVFILASGIYFFFSRTGSRREESRALTPTEVMLLPFVGIVTAAVCSTVGASGPILVVPVLRFLKVPMKRAVGIALFNSVLLSLSAAFGYMDHTASDILIYIVPGLAGIGLGVLAGERILRGLNPFLLKQSIAVLLFSVALFFVTKTLFYELL